MEKIKENKIEKSFASTEIKPPTPIRRETISEPQMFSQVTLNREDYGVIGRLLKSSHNKLWEQMEILVSKKELDKMNNIVREIEEIERIYTKLQQHLRQ